MNYRHAYHAGNFADVLKHIILARVITYMMRKPQPFRVIDTHAGAGRYDLAGAAAGKTGEWQDGIGRLLSLPLSDRAGELLRPYLASVAALNPDADGGAIRYYPGSPLVARHIMRREDTLVANELHPDDGQLLAREFHRAASTTVLSLDAWIAVKSLLPPKERRGLILIDPPFERTDEFQSLTTAMLDALSRFETGTYVVWYPIKDRSKADTFVAAVTERRPIKYLDVRLAVARSFAGLGLTQCGVLVINPPFTLRGEVDDLMPILVDALAVDSGAGFELKSDCQAG